jgi:diaminopimelate epimerase
MEITKMHGLGNDFIITTQSETEGFDLPALARRLCARRVNVGADGLIIVAPALDADIRMRIFNADGSEAEMCGNGIRCFARFVYDRKITDKKELTVSTLAGIMRPQLEMAGERVTGVKVDMGLPVFENEQIPVDAPLPAMSNRISVLGREIKLSTVLMGVPHTVVFTEEDDGLDPTAFGPAIETHPAFPKKTNVNFARVLSPDSIRITTWERGAGLTLACGTGACATAVVSSLKGFTQKKVNVFTQTGKLVIEYKDTGRVFMTGPAEYVFSGTAAPDGL